MIHEGRVGFEVTPIRPYPSPNDARRAWKWFGAGDVSNGVGLDCEPVGHWAYRKFTGTKGSGYLSILNDLEWTPF